MKKKKKE